MAVAVDAIGSADAQGDASSFSYTNLTVGPSASALIVGFAFGFASNLIIQWGSQIMTPLVVNGNGPYEVFLFGLGNPQPGNQTLSGSWSGNTNYAVNAISFVGSQTGFLNYASTNSNASPVTLNVTSNPGDFTVAFCAGTGPILSISQTQISLDNTTLPSAMAYAPGAATVTYTATFVGTSTTALIGLDIPALPYFPSRTANRLVM